MIIKTKLFNGWSKEIRLSLKKLTLPQGSMRYEVQERTRTWVAFDNDTPIGWCIVPDNLYMVYVKPAFRRKGIGKALVTAAKQFRKREGYCLPHTRAGVMLYKSTGIPQKYWDT